MYEIQFPYNFNPCDEEQVAEIRFPDGVVQFLGSFSLDDSLIPRLDHFLGAMDILLDTREMIESVDTLRLEEAILAAVDPDKGCTLSLADFVEVSPPRPESSVDWSFMIRRMERVAKSYLSGSSVSFTSVEAEDGPALMLHAAEGGWAMVAFDSSAYAWVCSSAAFSGELVGCEDMSDAISVGVAELVAPAAIERATNEEV